MIARYTEKISKLHDHLYQIGIDASKPSKDEFNVINHGDFWVNNMMFKYDDNGKPIAHIFVSITSDRNFYTPKCENPLIYYNIPYTHPI